MDIIPDLRVFIVTISGMSSTKTGFIREVQNEFRSKHRDTPWGKYAAKVLDHRLAITDSEIERLRRRVQQSIEHIDQMSAQYHESINKKPEEKKAEVKSKEDEILENTYNSMYDFE